MKNKQKKYNKYKCKSKTNPANGLICEKCNAAFGVGFYGSILVCMECWNKLRNNDTKDDKRKTKKND